MRSVLPAAVLLAAAASASAQSASPERSLMFDPNPMRQGVAPPAAGVAAPATQPAPGRAAAPRANATQRAHVPPPRAVAVPPRNDLPRLTHREPPPEPAAPQLGRIPFENGTFGLTTDTKYKTTEFLDGRRTPGFENMQRKDASYFGLSLSMPTDKATMFPLPLLPRPD